MTRTLKGKTALVTGAGRGFGRATALLLADAGATVILTARTASEIEAVAGEIVAAGGMAHAIAGDITDETFVDQLFSTIENDFEKLDIDINNAGTVAFGPIEEVPASKVRACLELNIVAVYMCMQRAIRLMRKTGGVGKIVNIGSVRSHWTEGGGCGAYNASKYGLRGLTETVARQLHGSDCRIAVGLICPGVADTSLTNPDSLPRPDWMSPDTCAQAVLHAVTAPDNVNIFDMTFFSVAQKPW